MLTKKQVIKYKLLLHIKFLKIINFIIQYYGLSGFYYYNDALQGSQ